MVPLSIRDNFDLSFAAFDMYQRRTARDLIMIAPSQLCKGTPAMNYDAALDQAIGRLHEEGRYRTFIDIERVKGQFPQAVWTRPDGEKQDITV